jgi:hypothetical protein
VLVVKEGAANVGQRGGVVHFGFRLLDPGDIGVALAAVNTAGGRVLDHGEFCPGEPYAAELGCSDTRSTVLTSRRISSAAIGAGAGGVADHVTMFKQVPTGLAMRLHRAVRLNIEPE